jgi:hypothetical protein
LFIGPEAIINGFFLVWFINHPPKLLPEGLESGSKQIFRPQTLRGNNCQGFFISSLKNGS